MTEYQRLSVNINTHTAEILREVTQRRGISATEAVRIAVALLGYMEVAKNRDDAPDEALLDGAGEQ